MKCVDYAIKTFYHSLENLSILNLKTYHSLDHLKRKSIWFFKSQDFFFWQETSTLSKMEEQKHLQKTQTNEDPHDDDNNPDYLGCLWHPDDLRERERENRAENVRSSTRISATKKCRSGTHSGTGTTPLTTLMCRCGTLKPDLESRSADLGDWNDNGVWCGRPGKSRKKTKEET